MKLSEPRCAVHFDVVGVTIEHVKLAACDVSGGEGRVNEGPVGGRARE